MSTDRGRRAGRVALLAAASLALAACTESYVDPYLDAPPLRPAAAILEDVNLAAIGLRAYDCDLFEAELARCYDSRTWGSVRAGRETVAHIHRELQDAGARYYGGSSHSRADQAPQVAGLDLGCYYDYETADGALRVVVVGPSGEGSPCLNGLPADGVSEVWIIAADFDVVLAYERVEYPEGLDLLLTSLPRPVAPEGDVYGGARSTVDGYYGPELPVAGDQPGVYVLTETVSIKDNVARGLVQYVGDGVATGAVGIVVATGDSLAPVPIVVRPGESAPFEFKVPRRTKPDDLVVLPNWTAVTDEWRGALYLTGPTADKKCADGVEIDGAPVKALRPTKKEKCWVVTAQTTTAVGDRYTADALVATFNANGTVRDVFNPYLLRSGGGEPGLVRISTSYPDIALAWVGRSLSAENTGLWIRYVKDDDGAEPEPSESPSEG